MARDERLRDARARRRGRSGCGCCLSSSQVAKRCLRPAAGPSDDPPLRPAAGPSDDPPLTCSLRFQVVRKPALDIVRVVAQARPAAAPPAPRAFDASHASSPFSLPPLPRPRPAPPRTARCGDAARREVREGPAASRAAWGRFFVRSMTTPRVCRASWTASWRARTSRACRLRRSRRPRAHGGDRAKR